MVSRVLVLWQPADLMHAIMEPGVLQIPGPALNGVLFVAMNEETTSELPHDVTINPSPTSALKELYTVPTGDRS